ncbi:peptidase M20 [Clostridia bacterium]|nr:peptidase M20 [Clostridia bacterium]
MNSVDDSTLTQTVAALEPQLVEWRRYFHAHPELSYKEANTGAAIREALAGLGIDSVRVPGSESFYAVLDGARPGPSIIIRADMDALPIQEASGKPYKSQCDGVMHACGHDAHIAMALGAAAILAERREDICGSVIFCFQSAEELSGGTAELLAALRESGREIGQAVGVHIWSPIPVSQIQILDGPAMSGLYAFEITLTGRGGHGSRPDLSIDPIKPLCDLALKLSALPTRLVSPLDSAVVHVCKVESGTRWNIFPDTAVLEGGVRFFKPEHQRLFTEGIERLTRTVSDEWGVSYNIRDVSRLAPVVNAHDCVSRARAAAGQVDGLTLSNSAEPLCASDNMSDFLTAYPGVYAFLGCGNSAKGIDAVHHNAAFDIDESALRLGVEFFCRYILHN